MTYGLGTRAPGENKQVEQGREPASRPWEALSEACRLAIVERALRATDDGFPLAL